MKETGEKTAFFPEKGYLKYEETECVLPSLPSLEGKDVLCPPGKERKMV